MNNFIVFRRTFEFIRFAILACQIDLPEEDLKEIPWLDGKEPRTLFDAAYKLKTSDWYVLFSKEELVEVLSSMFVCSNNESNMTLDELTEITIQEAIDSQNSHERCLSDQIRTVIKDNYYASYEESGEDTDNEYEYEEESAEETVVIQNEDINEDPNEDPNESMGDDETIENDEDTTDYGESSENSESSETSEMEPELSLAKCVGCMVKKNKKESLKKHVSRADRAKMSQRERSLLSDATSDSDDDPIVVTKPMTTSTSARVNSVKNNSPAFIPEPFNSGHDFTLNEENGNGNEEREQEEEEDKWTHVYVSLEALVDRLENRGLIPRFLLNKVTKILEELFQILKADESLNQNEDMRNEMIEEFMSKRLAFPITDRKRLWSDESDLKDIFGAIRSRRRILNL
eukprot:TRINITY_DN9275_c0_g1_i2.p1 TRINITY_DN9275_c0_g1~~TRINITY_DN9275_c0_g1_i2.p1  ORF type:complete len:402 (-),score=102.46 TRINITY_DN9275_c0_g1_i2:542-1747(-)